MKLIGGLAVFYLIGKSVAKR